MANWCDGTIKVRGPLENIVNWIKTLKGDARISQHDNEVEIFIPFNTGVSDVSRNFISGSDFSEKDKSVFCFDISAAWSFKSGEYQKVAKEYGIDFRIHGYEKGMCFEQLIEIVNGEITIDETKKYNDYKWEAYDPRIGG